MDKCLECALDTCNIHWLRSDNKLSFKLEELESKKGAKNEDLLKLKKEISLRKNLDKKWFEDYRHIQDQEKEHFLKEKEEALLEQMKEIKRKRIQKALALKMEFMKNHVDTNKDNKKQKTAHFLLT